MQNPPPLQGKLVEFLPIVLHCPHTTALSKAFPPESYITPLYWVLSFVVVRHHRLGHGYWAGISHRLGSIALSWVGGAHSVETHDALSG